MSFQLLKVSVVVLGLLLPIIGLAQNFYGLAPNHTSISKAEAVTVSPTGTQALFYNPAALSNQGLGVNVIGVEFSTNLQGTPVAEDATEIDVESILAGIDPDKPQKTQISLGAFDITLPYFAITSFNKYEISSAKRLTEEIYDIKMKNNLGLATGLAISWGPISLGASSFVLNQLATNSTPTTDELLQIKDKALYPEKNPNPIDYPSFTTLEYGTAQGQNIGVLYQPYENNETGLGIAILNQGNLEFSQTLETDDTNVKKAEENALKEANKLGLAPSVPEAIKESTSIGLLFALNDLDDFYTLKLAVDHNMIESPRLEGKNAANFEFGLRLPDKLALLASQMFEAPDGNKYHIGFREFVINLGVREKEYSVGGIKLGFHGGWEKKVSLLNLDIGYYSLIPVENEIIKQQQGIEASLSLTLIF